MATKVRNGKLLKVVPQQESSNKKDDKNNERFIPAVLQGFDDSHITDLSDDRIFEVNIEDIKDRKNNNFIKDKIEELARSIDEIGLKQPIIVKPNGRDEEGNELFEVIAGHRRLAAYKLLKDKDPKKYKKIRAYILEGEELKNENKIYLETNTTSRNITLYEALLNCELDEIDFNDELFKVKYNNMFYPDGNISKKEKYDNNSIIKYLEATIKDNFPTLDDVKADTIRRYYHLIRNSSEELTKAILDGKITVNQARIIARASKDKQPELINEILFGNAFPKMNITEKDEEKVVVKDSYKEMLKIDNRLRNCLKVDLSIIETDDWTPNTIAYFKQMKKALSEIEKLESMPRK